MTPRRRSPSPFRHFKFIMPLFLLLLFRSSNVQSGLLDCSMHVALFLSPFFVISKWPNYHSQAGLPPPPPLHDKWSKILPRALFPCSKWGVDSRGFPPQSPSLFVEPSSDKRLGREGRKEEEKLEEQRRWGSSLDMSSAERKRDFSASLLPFHYLTITSHPSSFGFVALTSVFGIFDTYQRTDRTEREERGLFVVRRHFDSGLSSFTIGQKGRDNIRRERPF